jgi:Aerotolerance regulator N-terminal
MTLGWPAGLLGLLALPAIVWLHRYVVQAAPQPVSNLDLWADALDAGAEGTTPRRPPLTWVLVLELLAATALVTVLADVRLGGPTLTPPTLGLVVDTSASMTGGPPGERPTDQVRARLAALPPGARVVLAAAWPAPRILADGGVQDALAALDALPWTAPRHDPTAALGLLGALGVEQPWVLTDDPEVRHPSAVHLGAPADNVGFVGATWPEGGRPTLAVQAFGDADVPLVLTVEAAGVRSTVDVIAPRGSFRPVELAGVPAEAQTVVVSLSPGGSLDVDDRVTLARPATRPVGVAVRLADGPAADAFRAVVTAIDALRLEDADPGLVIGPPGAAAPGQVALEVLGGAADHRATAISADVFSPLLVGVDLVDLQWPASAAAPPPGARVHLTSAEGPLLWQIGSTFTLNLATDAPTNLFRREGFVALMANLADELARRDGQIPSANVRAGDVVPLLPPATWATPIRWRHPDGAQTELPPGREARLGPLTEPGAHAVTADGQEVVSFAVSFADPQESDLTRRVPDPPGAWAPVLTVSAPSLAGSVPTWPWLAAIGALIGAWTLLGPRGTAGGPP